MKKATGTSLGLRLLGAGLLAGGLSVRPASAQQPAADAPAPSPEQLAQTESSLKQRVAAISDVPLAIELPGLTPSVADNVPTAWGFTEGQAAFGVGVQNRQVGADKSAGAMGVVVGLGDPVNRVGIDAGFTDLSIRRPFDAGSFNLKIHRALTSDTHVAIGAENVADYGGSSSKATDTPHSYYAVLSHRFRLNEDPNRIFSRLYVTVGAGNGRFREFNAVQGIYGSRVRPIGSAGINLGSQLNTFVEYNGEDVNAGLSIVPFKTLPLVVTPAVANINHKDDPHTRFTLGVGYLFNY